MISMPVKPKDQPDSDIIEFSFLSVNPDKLILAFQKFNSTFLDISSMRANQVF